MLSRADDDVEGARRSVVRSSVSFSGEAYALPIARPRFDAHFDRVSAVHHAFAVANVALGSVFARAAAARTRSVELHPVRRLRNLPRAFALWASIVRLHE